MNTNDLGAMAMSSVVYSILSSWRRPFYKILLENYRRDLCPHIYLLMNINDLGAMIVSSVV